MLNEEIDQKALETNSYTFDSDVLTKHTSVSTLDTGQFLDVDNEMHRSPIDHNESYQDPTYISDIDEVTDHNAMTTRGSRSQTKSRSVERERSPSLTNEVRKTQSETIGTQNYKVMSDIYESKKSETKGSIADLRSRSQNTDYEFVPERNYGKKVLPINTDEVVKNLHEITKLSKIGIRSPTHPQSPIATVLEENINNPLFPPEVKGKIQKENITFKDGIAIGSILQTPHDKTPTIVKDRIEPISVEPSHISPSYQESMINKNKRSPYHDHDDLAKQREGSTSASNDQWNTQYQYNENKRLKSNPYENQLYFDQPYTTHYSEQQSYPRQQQSYPKEQYSNQQYSNQQHSNQQQRYPEEQRYPKQPKYSEEQYSNQQQRYPEEQRYPRQQQSYPEEQYSNQQQRYPDLKQGLDQTMFGSDYEKMQYESKQRANYRVKFSILRDEYPHMNIPEPSDNKPLDYIEVEYREYVKRIHVDSSVEQNNQYLFILWLLIEVIGCKLLRLPFNGYTQNQLKFMNKYHMLLIELGESSYGSGLGQGWPVEIRILIMAVMNAVIFIFVKMLADKIGDEGADKLRDIIGDFLTNGHNKGKDVLRRAEEATADNPPPPPSSTQAQQPFGGFGDMIAKFAGAFMGGGDQQPQPKAELRKPSGFAARNRRRPVTTTA